MKWADLIARGDLNGYKEGGGYEGDRKIAEADPCEECGGQMEYVSMRAPNSYRAFARCRLCGEAVEF